MAEIAVEYLVSKLEDWIEKETNKKRVAQVTKIKAEFERIRPFLKYADWKRLIVLDNAIEKWVLDLVDLACEVEDFVDDDLYKRRETTTGLSLSSFMELVVESFNYFTSSKNNDKSLLSISLLHKRVSEKLNEANVRKQRSLFSNTKEATSERSLWHSKTFNLKAQSWTCTVGRDNEVEKLKEWLIAEDTDSPSIVAVTGPSGIGKTNVATRVFECVKRKFDCATWVFVYDRPVIGILTDMFVGFSENQPRTVNGSNLAEVDEKELVKMMVEYLGGKRFLVVLDGLDTLTGWELIKCVFPSKSRGKILLTTRSTVFPAVICTHVLHLEPLVPKEALELLKKWACLKNHESDEVIWPSSVEPFVEKILQICEGVPLLIATIGAMLSTPKLDEPKEWEKILCLLEEVSERRPQFDRIQKVLVVNYFSLPPVLKCCFLYCAIFPSHREIPCKRLIRIWVAEGFLAKNELGLTEEEIAKNLLDELVQRNLVEVAKLGENGEVISCKLIRLIQDFILEILSKDYIRVTSGRPEHLFPSKATRIIAVHREINSVTSSLNTKRTRSLLLFGENGLSTPSTLSNSMSNIKFLRVLELQHIPIDALPDEVGNLVLLRYMNLRGTKICDLPSSINNLRELQTLDIRETCVRAFPGGFDDLKMLRHLLLADSYSNRVVKLDGNIMYLKDLQTLAGIKLTEPISMGLKYLPQLLKLSVGEVEGRGNSLRLFDSINQMKTLNSLTIKCAWRKEIQIQIEISNPLENLEKLRVGGWVRDLLSWVCKLRSLKYLYLWDSMLSSDPMSALQYLPSLVVLSLCNAYKGKRMCCDDANGFCNLKKLLILNFEELDEWRNIEDGAMAMLQTLIIAKCPKLKMPPKGLQSLTNLQMLQIKDMPAEFIKETRELLLPADLNFSVVF